MLSYLCIFLLLIVGRGTSEEDGDTVREGEAANEDDFMESGFGVRSLDPNVIVYRVPDVPIRRPVSDDEEEDLDDDPIYQPIDLTTVRPQVGQAVPLRDWSYVDTRAVTHDWRLRTRRTVRPISGPRRRKKLIPRDRQIVVPIETGTQLPQASEPTSTSSTTTGITPAPTTTTTTTEVVTGKPVSWHLVVTCILCGLAISILFGGIAYGISQLMKERRWHQPITPAQGPLVKPKRLPRKVPHRCYVRPVVQLTAPMAAPDVTSDPLSLSSTEESEPSVLGIVGQKDPDHVSIGAETLPSDEVAEIVHPHRQS